MIRLDKKYDIQEVISKVQFKTKMCGKSSKVDFDGNLVNMASDRYKCFVKNGTRCVGCGLEAEYFYLEKREGDKSYHFNLYGTRDGEEILFTKDHILPKCKGGKDEIENYQTMCTWCNLDKASKFPMSNITESLKIALLNSGCDNARDNVDKLLKCDVCSRTHICARHHIQRTIYFLGIKEI